MSTRAAQRRQRPTGSMGGPQPDIGAATGLASLFTLMVLTFGVPGALWVFGRDQLPSTVVKPSVMWDALRRTDDGHLFLQGLYLAAWVGWFLFFLSVFLEIVAQVQRRAAVRLPGLGWLQRGVGTLVTAAVVIVASPVAAMADAPAELHAGGGVVATQVVVHGADEDEYGVARGATVREAEVDNPTYTVRSGDSLWRIAQEQLGDPNRFADIAKLNDGRVMPGGTVFRYSEFLQSGWVLIMPSDMGSARAGAGGDAPAELSAGEHVGGSQQADAWTPDTPTPTSLPTPSSTSTPASTTTPNSTTPALESAPAPAKAPSGAKTYTVRQGDSLSSIAKSVLGDSRRWDELFELNRGRPQAGGPPIWSADLIWPGDVLVLPDDANVGTGSSAAPLTQSQPSVSAPAQTGDNVPSFRDKPPLTDDGLPAADPAALAPGQVPGGTQLPHSPRVGEQIPSQAPVPAQNGAPQPGQDRPAQPAAPETLTFGDTETDSGKTMAAIGGLLAAGLLSTLAAKRLRKLMQRRPGERIAMRPPDTWELELSTVENPTGRVFIDAALRTLSAKLAELDRILPDITATVLKPHGLEVHLARSEPPVSPFYADPQRPGVWICPLGAPLTGHQRPVPQAPYPALVSLGFDEGDDAVLVDLESTHGISLLAPAEESVAVLRAMAVELATGTWADQVEVTLVGFGAELPSLFEAGRLSHTESLPRAVEAVARWSATVDAVLDKRDVSLREARTYPDPELAQITKTRVLLSAAPLDPRSAYQLRQLLSGRQRTSMAVVAVVQEPEHLLSDWVVTGPRFHTPPSQAGGTGIKVRMQALRDEQYAAIVRDLSGSGLDDEWESAQQDGMLEAKGARPELPAGGGGSESGSGGRKGRGHAARKQLPAGPVRAALPHRASASLEAESVPGASLIGDPAGSATNGSSGTSASGAPHASGPPRAKPLATPEPKHANRFRIPVDDLFRIEALPPVPGMAVDAPVPLPKPGTAKHARHALNPANLPQFDLVVAPWHGRTGTDTITAVPNAAPTRTPPPPMLGLTTLAGAGTLAEAPPNPADRLVGLGLEPVVAAGPGAPGPDAVEPPRRPGQWQNAYWNQRKAAEAEKQTFDPMTMARSINVLGPIELSGTAATAGSRAADLAEVAAFVMLHPGCSAAQIAAELWPGRKGAVTIRDAQVARLREWLGTDAYGEQHLLISPHGYAMGPSVTCDWLDFVMRVQAGELVSAISLVRGRPFEDAPLRRYGWAEALRHEMSALIIDTAHYVAQACLSEDNPRGAQNAAYRGLQAAPESELLYRDLLTALAALGDLSSARQHADTLIAYADREGIDLQPETTALLRDVLQAVPGA
ncbi:MAG: LysM peptidoglycan-binding domain-containing protein [Catenulispora sp.]|nr:LysM peptidoglycan-binding domain-containing protein [Catenulispora sp.]